jgi:hypothetical protein
MTTIAQHLMDRHVDVSRYHVAIDEADRVATFLLFNQSGTLCGYQQYRPDCDKKRKNNPRDGRYYTYRTPGQIAVFGLETLDRRGPVFLTEGIFDTVRLHNLGLAGIGTLTNHPTHIASWLMASARRKVAVCDPGRPGELLAELADEVLVCPGPEDLGAMTTEQVTQLMRRYL